MKMYERTSSHLLKIVEKMEDNLANKRERTPEEREAEEHG